MKTDQPRAVTKTRGSARGRANSSRGRGTVRSDSGSGRASSAAVRTTSTKNRAGKQSSRGGRPRGRGGHPFVKEDAEDNDKGIPLKRRAKETAGKQEVADATAKPRKTEMKKKELVAGESEKVRKSPIKKAKGASKSSGIGAVKVKGGESQAEGGSDAAVTESGSGVPGGKGMSAERRAKLDARRATRDALAAVTRAGNPAPTEAAVEALEAVLPALSQYEMTALTNDASHLSGRWTNKQRVLCLGSRGMRSAHRYFFNDWKSMLPHHHAEMKWEKRLPLDQLVEAADLANCNNILYLESRKQRLYLWLSKAPTGPSVRFEVLSLHTSEGQHYVGNCLKYSRPLLIFDKWFNDLRQLQLIKQLFLQAVGTPRYHPNAKPFHDHAIALFYNDGKIWFRHYQIIPIEPLPDQPPIELREIGPRFCLDPIRIFASPFGGKTLWKNPARYPQPAAGAVAHSAEEAEQTAVAHAGPDPDIFTSESESDGDC